MGRSGALAYARRSAARNASAWSQSDDLMTTWPAMQLWPEFCRRIVAIVLGLIREVGIGPGAGYHDDGGDSPELGGDRLLQLRAVLAPAALRRCCAIALRRPPDDRVEGRGRPGDVHMHQVGMAGEIGADRRPAADDAEQSRFDEGRERALVYRHQSILRGVDLQQGGAVVGEQFVQHVEHRDRGHVAGSEHESDSARFGGGALGEAGARARGARGDAGSSHTSPVKPDSRNLSMPVRGKACTRVRPPGARSMAMPSSGFAPFARRESVSM